jgi:hypothetical protein
MKTLIRLYSRQLSHLHASYFPSNFTEIALASSSEYRRAHAWPQDLIAAVNVTALVVYFASNCNSDFRQVYAAFSY